MNKNNPFRQSRKNVWKSGEKYDPEVSSEEEEYRPWSEMKQTMIDKEKQSTSKSKPVPKNVMKKRDEEHRKFLITEKPKEATTWEKFTDDEDGEKEKLLPKAKSKPKNKKKKPHKPLGTLKRLDLINRFEKEGKNMELTSEDRNHIKKVITKHTAKGKDTFNDCLKDLRRRDITRFVQKWK